jgi:hypothetical protein
LGFVGDSFRKLDQVSHLDLRVGMGFSEKIGAALHRSIKDAVDTITKMPANFMTYPNGGTILPVQRKSRTPRPSRLQLNETYLASFGEMLIPRHLWLALQRFDVWIEPAIIAEWTRMMKDYAGRQGREIDDRGIAAAMTWADPTRDVRIAREQAERLLVKGDLHCVWSGKRLSADDLDLDHCFPWSAWPCSDLWNLMPANRAVNRREKKDRLPGDQIMRASQDRIMTWWGTAYRMAKPVIGERFILEAVSSLPNVSSDDCSLGDIYEAACLQRMRLKLDQQVPEWSGEKYL